MKLRIKGNTLRLRLSQGEIEQFSQDGEVTESIVFGSNASLRYSIKRVEKAQITANMHNGHVVVEVPVDVSKQWVNSDQVGFEKVMDNGTLILVEKDFQCLHKRPGEDESNNFPNPLAVNKNQ